MIGTPLQATDTMFFPQAPDVLWPILADTGRYPQWWPWFLFTHANPTAAHPVGSELYLRPMGFRSFTCRVVAVNEPHAMNLEYVGNFITGHAQWLLEPEVQGTRVSYVVDVFVHDVMVTLAAKVFDLGMVHSYSMRKILQNLQGEFNRKMERTP